jgi:serine/threonine protein phosphatase PrpC
MKKGGEDAYYIEDKILVVADGVGGWNSQGIDPAKYAKELCQK